MISLVIPVKNEEETIEVTLNSILKQSKKPDEVIIVDGGSNDKTKDIVRRYPFTLIERQNHTAGMGRNVGISVAKGDYIAFTDAGIELDVDWLRNLSSKTTDVVYGVFKPRITGLFSKCVSKLIVGKKDRFIASSLFKKSVFDEYGYFKDWKNSEDREFMERIKDSFSTCPTAIVTWDMPKDIFKLLKRSFLFAEENTRNNREKYIIKIICYWMIGILLSLQMMSIFPFLGVMALRSIRASKSLFLLCLPIMVTNEIAIFLGWLFGISTPRIEEA